MLPKIKFYWSLVRVVAAAAPDAFFCVHFSLRLLCWSAVYFSNYCWGDGCRYFIRTQSFKLVNDYFCEEEIYPLPFLCWTAMFVSDVTYNSLHIAHCRSVGITSSSYSLIPSAEPNASDALMNVVETVYAYQHRMYIRLFWFDGALGHRRARAHPRMCQACAA